MKIGSTLENQKIEKRIAITPEIAKKYISLGFDVQLSKNYGTHLGITEDEYKKIGVKFLSPLAAFSAHGLSFFVHLIL